MKNRKVIAGNWKMHHGPEATRDFFRRFPLGSLEDEGGDAEQADGSPGGGEDVSLLLFPPALSLEAALESRPDPGIAIGAQNIHWESEGAFTGEISAPMVAGLGATHVLVGHSERRHVFGETDEEVARKVKAALAAGLLPVVCVGETLDERREGSVEAVILRQLDAVLGVVLEQGSGGERPLDLMIAYEPVWAIGTGETATPEDASSAHGTLRGRLVEALGETRGRTCPILYGGSVKPANSAELLSAPDVDGVLVGGASLDPESFASIARSGRGAAGR